MESERASKSGLAGDGWPGVLAEGTSPSAAPDAGIVIPPADDFPGNETTFGRIAMDRSRTGTLQFEGDSDWLRVYLEAGRSYAITIHGAYVGAGTLPRILSRLRYPEGNVAEERSLLHFTQTYHNAYVYTPLVTGDHFIEVYDDPASTSNPLGSYRVSVDQGPVQFSDFDSDRTADMLVQGGGSVVAWFMANGAYDGGRVVGSGLPPGWTVVGTGEFDGDGLPDIALQNGRSVVGWFTDGVGNYIGGRQLANLDPGTRVIGTGDFFPAHGRTQLLVQGPHEGREAIYTVSGNTILSRYVGLPAGWNVVGVGDVNGDGTSDIILQNGGTVVEWLTGPFNALAQSGRLLTSSLPFGWQVTGMGDFNGDRTDDILIQGGNHVVDWIMQNGEVVGGNLISDTLPSGWSVRGTGDYNADGTSDISLQGGGTFVNWLISDGRYAGGNVIATGLTGWDIVGKT